MAFGNEMVASTGKGRPFPGGVPVGGLSDEPMAGLTANVMADHTAQRLAVIVDRLRRINGAEVNYVGDTADVKRDALGLEVALGAIRDYVEELEKVSIALENRIGRL